MIFLGSTLNYNKDLIPSEPIYGVQWVNDTTITMVRTDDATQMSYIIDDSNGTISSDFDNVFPWNETEIVTDTAGNKFLHFPDMWFRVGLDANNDINSVAVSKAHGTGNNWYLCRSFDYGIYGGSVNNTNNLIQSKSGITLITGGSEYVTKQLETRCANNSTADYTYYSLDLKHRFALIFLWWIEFATKKANDIMTGRRGTGSADFITTTGGTDSLTTPSGYNINTNQMRYHYIEDFVGNVQELLSGVVWGTDGNLYVTDNPNNFSVISTANMGLSLINRISDGYCVQAFGWNSQQPFLCYASKTITNDNYDTAFCCYGVLTTATGLALSRCGAGAYWNSPQLGVTTISRLYENSYSVLDLGVRLLRESASNFN